jgi:hypothetical protein
MAGDMVTAEHRRKRFRKALALAELTMGKWCEGERISYGHLYHVLSGRRESASLVQRVDAFTAKHLDSRRRSAVA